MGEQTNSIVELFRSLKGKKMQGAPPFTEWLDGRIVSCDVGEIEMTFQVRPEMSNTSSEKRRSSRPSTVSEPHSECDRLSR